MASIIIFKMKICHLALIGVLFLAEISGLWAQKNESLQYSYVCPKNFENVGRKCYHFSSTTGTWFQAYFNCRDLAESNFTVFTDRYDQRQLEHFLFRNQSKSRDHNENSLFWVGGFKDWKQKKWIYTDGSLMHYPSKKDIIINEEEDNWTCLLIDGNSKRWKAENCMEKRPFICEAKAVASVVLKVVDRKVKRKITIDDCISNTELLTKRQQRRCLKMLDGVENGRDLLGEPAAVIQQAKPAYSSQPAVVRAVSHICPQNWMSLGNQCYLFSKEKVTWSDAHFNCGQINAKLAVIRSKVQDQKLRIFLNGFTEKQERWIGGRYNSKTKQWIWALNGKALKYNGFIREISVPNNDTEALNWQAIVMDPKHAYRWTHRNEMEKHFYICQVKGRAVKRLNYPRRPSATIEIISDRRNQRRNQQNVQFRNNRTSRRAGRNKRT